MVKHEVCNMFIHTNVLIPRFSNCLSSAELRLHYSSLIAFACIYDVALYKMHMRTHLQVLLCCKNMFFWIYCNY